MRRSRTPALSLGIESPPTWLEFVITLGSVAIDTLLVYPLKDMAPGDLPWLSISTSHHDGRVGATSCKSFLGGQ